MVLTSQTPENGKASVFRDSMNKASSKATITQEPRAWLGMADRLGQKGLQFAFGVF